MNLDLCGVAEVRRQLEKVEVLSKDGHIRIGVRARLAACPGTEEESQADVFVSAQCFA